MNKKTKLKQKIKTKNIKKKIKKIKLKNKNIYKEINVTIRRGNNNRNSSRRLRSI